MSNEPSPSPQPDPNADTQPVEITRHADATILIRWSDGALLRYRPQRLRQGCPCATCREKKRADEPAEQDPASTGKPSRGLPILSAAEARPLEVTGMRPVGQYAYHIEFSDGHNSGIFPFALLRQLGEPGIRPA